MNTDELEKKLLDAEVNFKNTLERSNHTLTNIFASLRKMCQIIIKCK